MTLRRHPAGVVVVRDLLGARPSWLRNLVAKGAEQQGYRTCRAPEERPVVAPEHHDPERHQEEQCNDQGPDAVGNQVPMGCQQADDPGDNHRDQWWHG